MSTATLLDTLQSRGVVLAAFLADCCVQHRDAKTPAAALFDAYRGWCDENGERAENKRSFGMRLTERGFVRKRSSGGMHTWLGVGLSDLSDRSDPHTALAGNLKNSLRANQEYGSLGSHGSLAPTERTEPNFWLTDDLPEPLKANQENGSDGSVRSVDEEWI